jgi:hypothetical protein
MFRRWVNGSGMGKKFVLYQMGGGWGKANAEVATFSDKYGPCCTSTPIEPSHAPHHLEPYLRPTRRPARPQTGGPTSSTTARAMANTALPPLRRERVSEKFRHVHPGSNDQYASCTCAPPSHVMTLRNFDTSTCSRVKDFRENFRRTSALTQTLPERVRIRASKGRHRRSSVDPASDRGCIMARQV